MESSGQQIQQHATGSVRHAEKRRTGTCVFADRVASTALDAFRSVVPKFHRDAQRHECVAAILAHFPPDRSGEEEGDLQVVALGVGTKFLPDDVIREEERRAIPLDGIGHVAHKYGTRVRDCHAEVLARRAFRWQLAQEIRADLTHGENKGSNCLDALDGKSNPIRRPILQRLPDLPNSAPGNPTKYGLIPGVTLHFYTSSAPCGNATLKKFAKMERETFDASLGRDEWPVGPHEPIGAHSIRLGQFALLVKRDYVLARQSKEALELENNNTDSLRPSEDSREEKKSKKKLWPANESDDWCPPGTSIVGMNRGTIHTCSDKMARWNCLGLQGSLLSSIVESPLHAMTLTVGRKMTECICRRAVCCRAWGYGMDMKRRGDAKYKPSARTTGNNVPDLEDVENDKVDLKRRYELNHPTLMGTAVYMDENGVLDMSGEKVNGQDVRFGSNLCWAYAANMKEVECIDGGTGFARHYVNDVQSTNGDVGTKGALPSRVSTASLVDTYIAISKLMGRDIGNYCENDTLSLQSLRLLKRNVSPDYEEAKDELLKKHRIFKQWKRREDCC